MLTRINLALHVGSNRATFEQIKATHTPKATATWHPMPHATVVEQVLAALAEADMTVVGKAHALSGDDGERYFGLLEIEGGAKTEDYALVLGVRNSHDKRFPAGIAVGSGVLATDNLSFAGEVAFGRKHTRHIARDLPGMVRAAVARIPRLREVQDARFAAYKRAKITDLQAHDILVRSLDERIVSPSKLGKVLKEWRDPVKLQGKTAWRLYNAYTEVLKDYSIFALPATSQRLNVLVDEAAGFAGAERWEAAVA